jgi:hypothetical protein
MLLRQTLSRVFVFQAPVVICKVEIVDIDGSIDYWHQEGARGR